MTSARGARPLFVAAVLASSFLLFLVQPMIARMALPRLGGAPAVDDGTVGTQYCAFNGTSSLVAASCDALRLVSVWAAAGAGAGAFLAAEAAAAGAALRLAAAAA